MRSQFPSKQEEKPRLRFPKRFLRHAWLEPSRQVHAGRRKATFWLLCVFFCACWLAGGNNSVFAATRQTVAPDATPRITHVQPAEAQPGSRVTLTIDGERFAEGVYASFSDPAIRVLSTRRLSDTRLEVDVAVGDKAQPESVHLYVANPAGTSGERSFAIVAAPASAAGTSSSGTDAPEVSAVEPDHVSPGSKASIKVTGKKFAKGAKVAFENPGIRVLGTEYKKSTQLVVEIEVAPNAPTGKTGMFVVNPDESEVETGFEVTATTGGNSQAATNALTERFSVINLGEAISILQNPNKPRGVLILAGKKLTYQEGGKDVFVAGPGDIEEIAPNILFGFNTSTFHIILTSGKTYNFVSSSLTPADTHSIVETLQRALK